MKDKKFVINIGRQLGSGGRVIGEMLATRLGAHYYDKGIIEEAAQSSGFDKRFFEKTDEHKGFFGSMFNFRGSLFGNADMYDMQLSEESMFKIVSDVIRSAAERESCVFVGRCADYVLRDNPNCLNVFISADMSDRVKRISSVMGIDEAKAAEKALVEDQKRSSFYNFYSSYRWGEASTYHLCVNSSVLGMEKTADFIEQYAKMKLEL